MKLREVFINIAEMLYYGPGNSVESSIFHFLLMIPFIAIGCSIVLAIIFAILYTVMKWPWVLLLAYPIGLVYFGKASRWGRE